MIYEKKLMPELMLESYRNVTPELLRSLGASHIISDIDNTLAPYETAVPDENLLAWFRLLENAGITIALVSNNEAARVEKFTLGLDIPAYAKVGKPSVKYLRMAMDKLGGSAADTVFLGDQLLTDVLAAHKLGIKALIVPPIKDKATLFFRFKRWLERPYIRKYRQLHGGDRDAD